MMFFICKTKFVEISQQVFNLQGKYMVEKGSVQCSKGHNSTSRQTQQVGKPELGSLVLQVASQSFKFVWSFIKISEASFD